MQTTASQRWIPEAATRISSKKSDAVAYLFPSAFSGKVCAIGYRGKAVKPAFHYSFRDNARRLAYVSRWMTACDDGAASKAAREAAKRSKLAQPHGLKLGDVLYGSWGYDQTNVEFWQVTKLVGKRMVEIRELACESQSTEFMQGNAVPIVDSFTKKEAKRVRVDENDSVRLYSFCSLSKAAPILVGGVKVGYQPRSWTAYA